MNMPSCETCYHGGPLEKWRHYFSAGHCKVLIVIIINFHSSYIIIILLQVKGKLEILSSIRDHRKKSRETREVAYTSRYTSEHLIPNPVYTQDQD